VNEIDQIKKNAGIVDEGRVFNNTSEMLRSLLNDIKRVSDNIERGAVDITNIGSDLDDIRSYYMDAEIKQPIYK